MLRYVTIYVIHTMMNQRIPCVNSVGHGWPGRLEG